MTNPDIVPYSHNPPGHTCGLPCCSKDLQVHLRVQKPPRSCMGIQEHEILGQNFTFKGKLKSGPGLENGFFSVQEARENPHAGIPKFGSVRGSLNNVSEEQKKYNFLKGREITLPEAEDPYATEKLYLEDFKLEESDDFESFDLKGYDSGIETMKENEIDYYVTVKNPSDPEKGVPYDPKNLDNTQIYPWDLMKGLKDSVSYKSVSEKGDDSSISNYYSLSSNYYEVIPAQIPEENDNIVAEKMEINLEVGSDKSKKNSKMFSQAVPLPTVPLPTVAPKLPVQTQFNHPPLKKPDTTKPAVTSDNSNQHLSYKQNSDTDSSQTKYNMYSSVCSLTSMANKMSKEAYERFMSLDRTSLVDKSYRRDIRDFDFTGNDMPIGSKNLDLAITKAKLNHLFKEKGTTSLFHKESKQFESLIENTDQIDGNFEEIDRDNMKKDTKIGADKIDKLQTKLMDFDELSDEDDDYSGVINPGFKHINVDGKILGSRHSLDHDSIYGEEVCDRFLHLWEREDNDSVKEDEMKVMELLKQRLRNVDNSEDSPSGQSFNDNPVTLIL